MKTILPEFIVDVERAYNYFYISLLAMNFIQQRPFKRAVVFPVKMTRNYLSAKTLNNVSEGTLNEYESSVRRHFVGDAVGAYERYSMLMYASHNNNGERVDLARTDIQAISAVEFEQLNGLYTRRERDFLLQMRRLKTSLVDYNGDYCSTNELDFKFGRETLVSQGKEGTPILVSNDTLIWIYNRLLEVVKRGNEKYFVYYGR